MLIKVGIVLVRVSLSKFNMVKKIILITCVAVSVLALDSCKKYPDGPTISLRTRTARVANTWKVGSATINGKDVTSSYNNINYSETYTKDGAYSYASSLGSGSGKWAFENSDAQIKRNGVSGQSSEDMTILKLKEVEFWYSFTDNGDKYELHLVPK